MSFQYSNKSLPQSFAPSPMTASRPNLTENEKSLLAAGEEGSLTRLKMVLWRTENFDARDKKGNTVLHLACKNSINLEQIVGYLVTRQEVDVNARNDAGETPLHMLAYKGDSRAVSFLLKESANPLAIDNAGNTPAHRYLETGFSTGFQVLTDCFYRPQMIINMANAEGNTLLHMAAIHDPFSVHDLLAKGGDPRIKNNAGQLAEELAADLLIAKILRGARKAIEENAAKYAAYRSASTITDPSSSIAVSAVVSTEVSITATNEYVSARPTDDEDRCEMARLAKEFIDKASSVKVSKLAQ
jgi:ankyrin repeat protein